MKKSYRNATSLINNCDGSIQIHRNFFIKGIKMKPRGFLLQIISFSVASMLTTSIIFPIILQMALLSSAVADEQRTYPINPKHEQVDVSRPTKLRRKEVDVEVAKEKEKSFPRLHQWDYILLTP